MKISSKKDILSINFVALFIPIYHDQLWDISHILDSHQLPQTTLV